MQYVVVDGGEGLWVCVGIGWGVLVGEVCKNDREKT